MKKAIMLVLCFYTWCVHAYTERYQQGGGNDTMSQAENVGQVGSSAITINGVCNIRWSLGDIDWYSFVPAGNILSWSVRVSNASLGHGVPIVLYSSSGQIVEVFSVSYSFGYGSDFTDSGSVMINPGEKYYLLCGDQSFNQNYEGGQSLSYSITLSTNGGNPPPPPPSYTKPDLRPYTPEGWSSSLVVSKSSSSTVDDSLIKDTDNLYVSWAVVCRDKDVSSAFNIALYLDGVIKKSWSQQSLSEDYYTGRKGFSLGKLSAGTHILKIVADSSSAISESNESNNTLSKTITVSKTTPTTYTIKFAKNDGSGIISNRSFTYGSSVTLPWIGSGFGWSRSGYDFIGWSTYSSATSASYNNGANVYNLASAGGSITLYAVWKTKGYTIRFNKNDGSGITASRNFAYGQRQALPWIGSGLGWSRSGYDFIGWSTYSSATSASYNNGANVYNLASAGGSITLYAVWKTKGYTIRFNKNDGSGITASRNFAYGQSQTLPWIGSGLGWSRSGYDFVGWSTYSSATSASYNNGANVYNLASAGGSITLYAVWKTKGYTIRFNKNDGSGITASRNFAYGQSQTLPWIGSGLGWSRSGYNFLGWNTYPSATTARYANGAKLTDLIASGVSLTLYAVWALPSNTYLVRFHGFLPPGKTGTPPTATRVYIAGVKYQLPWVNSELGWNPRYAFLGWERYNDSESTLYKNGETIVLSSIAGVEIDLYSVWDDYDWNDTALGYGIKTSSISSKKADDKIDTHIYGITENGGTFQLSLTTTDTGNIFIYDETTLLESTCTITYTTTGMLITFGEHALTISEDEEMPVATWIY